MEEKRDAAVKVVAKGAIFVFVGIFLSKVFTYLYRVLIARTLGPEQYGLFSLGFAVFMTGMLVGKLGIPQGINRFVSKYVGMEDEGRVRGTILAGIDIVLPVSLLIGTILFLTAPFIAAQVFNDPAVTPLIRIFALTLPFRIVLTAVLQVFKGFQRMDYYSGVEHVLQSVVAVSLAGIAVFLGYGVLGATAAYAVSIVVTAAAAVWILERRVFPVLFSSTPPVKDHRELLVYSLPLLLAGVAGTMMGQIDTLMLGYFPNTSTGDVGVYNAALPTGKLVGAVSMAFGMILFPVITRHLAQGEAEEATDIASITLRWVVAGAFPATLLLVFFARPVLTILFGPAYTAGALVLSIIAAASLVNAVASPLSQFLAAKDRTKLVMWNNAAAAVINIPLNLFLIPVYGIVGAGIATTFAVAFSSVLGALEAVYLLNVRPHLTGIHIPVIASGAAAATVYALLHAAFTIVPGWALVPGGLLFALLYGALFLLLGGLREEDVVVLKAVEQRSGMDLEPVKRIVRRLSRA